MTDPLHRAALALARWHVGTPFSLHEAGEAVDMVQTILHDDACAYGSLDATRPCTGWRVEELDHDAAAQVAVLAFRSAHGPCVGHGFQYPGRRHVYSGWARQLAEEGF